MSTKSLEQRDTSGVTAPRLVRTPHASGQDSGFTMLEMAVVLAISIVLVAIAVPSVKGIKSYRARNDARSIVGELMVARMRASASFSRSKLQCVIATRTCTLYLQANGNQTTDAWVAEKSGGALPLSPGVSFSIPSNASGGAGNQTSLVQGAAGVTATSGTIELTFNSRGLPINATTGVLVPDYAIYLVDTNNRSFAVAVDAGGRASVYRFSGASYGFIKD